MTSDLFTALCVLILFFNVVVPTMIWIVSTCLRVADYTVRAYKRGRRFATSTYRQLIKRNILHQAAALLAFVYITTGSWRLVLMSLVVYLLIPWSNQRRGHCNQCDELIVGTGYHRHGTEYYLCGGCFWAFDDQHIRRWQFGRVQF